MIKYCPKPIALHGFLLVSCVLLLAGCNGSSGSSSADTVTAPSVVSGLAAPASPTNLAATAGNAQVSLTWSASSTATSYDVQRSLVSGGPYSQIASVTSASYTDETVTNATAYYYVVSAVNAGGHSANSAEAAATPDPTITTPSVPTGLAAAAGNAQVSLTWSVSGTATSYHVKRATTSGGPYSQIAAPTSISYTDAAVANGTTYYYVVSALDSAGESVNSAQVSALPVAPTAIPAIPTGLSAIPGNGTVALTWSAVSGATSYPVLRATTSGGPYTQIAAVNSTVYTDSAVTNGTTYYYVVESYNSAGGSANSVQVNALPTAPATIPTTPTGLTATPGNASVALTWSAPSGATAYHVKRATTSGGPYTQIAAPTSSSYTDASVTNGTTYYYVVSALDSAGESANSSQASALPTGSATLPAAPTGLSATPGNATVTLTWSAVSGAASYPVKRATTNGGPYTQIGAITSTTFIDTAVTNGTTYYYVVEGYNSVGGGPNSTQVSATPVASGGSSSGGSSSGGSSSSGGTGGNPLGPITTISPTSAGVGAQITIQGTNIGYATNSSLAAISAGRQFADITDGTWTVVNANEIIYTVPADGATGQFSFWNAAGSGYYPFLFTFIPTNPPAAPPTLSQISGNAEVDLTWGPVPNGVSYNIWRSTTSGSGYTNIANVSTASIYSDLTVTNGVTYYYVVTAVDAIGSSSYSPQVVATPHILPPSTATVTVTPGTTHSISPYIYGVNSAGNSSFFAPGTSTALPHQLTLDRVGGDRWTAYNWVTNASNAGSDYNYENDSLLNTTPNAPAGQAKSQIAFDQANGLASIITFQMQGLVAADETGPVSTANPPQAGRFDAVQYAKGAAFATGSNLPLTGPVYMDEYAYNVNALFAGEGIFTATPTSYPVFGQLDNEPDLWNSTHLEVEGATEITPAAFVAKSIALATALKNKFPKMTIFGAVNWGWSGVQSWQNAISGTGNTGNNWFIDYYAQQLAAASASYGAPLVDVYDFHWYPQIMDPVSNTQLGYLNSSPLADSQTQLIVQSPRSLYDPTYVESSWIPSTIGGAAIDALPRFQAKLAAANPGMKLAITEYFPGGGATIAGTLAEADLLGAFGANNLFAATVWPLQAAPSVVGGFAAFRDFDGAGSNFGDTSVAASSSNIANVSAYVSTDSAHPGRVVMVLINRSTSAQVTTVSGQTLSGTAHIYQMTAANVPTGSTTMMPTSIGTQAASGSSITLTLPPYSVTTVDIH